MDDARAAKRSKRHLILYKKRVGRTQVKMCTRSEVDATNLFDVPILYGPSTSTLQSETNNGNLFEVPIRMVLVSVPFKVMIKMVLLRD